jgi:hypothetical protein
MIPLHKNCTSRLIEAIASLGATAIPLVPPNVPHRRAARPGEPLTFAKTTSNFTRAVMPQRNNVKKTSNEADAHLTVQAIQ